MTNSLIPIKELKIYLSKDFQTEELDQPTINDAEAVKKKLAHIIQYLLDKDMNRLLNIFYRLDLKESKVTSILNESPVEEISTKLAELVIERETEKIKTRLKYRDF